MEFRNVKKEISAHCKSFLKKSKIHVPTYAVEIIRHVPKENECHIIDIVYIDSKENI